MTYKRQKLGFVAAFLISTLALAVDSPASPISFPSDIVLRDQKSLDQVIVPSDISSDLVAARAFSDLKQPVTDKKYDAALVVWDEITARPLDRGMLVTNPPSSLDLSQYMTMTGNQDSWGGCGGRSQIHCINIIKEMEHPYTPDLSFWYLDARQSQLLKGGIQDAVVTKTLVEKYGICTEASFPSDYDKSKVLTDSDGNPYRDYSAMPQITDAINQEAAFYKIKTLSDSKEPSVENIKSLLITYGPIFADGSMPLVTGNYVDQISGTIGSDGKVQFSRERPGEWTQVYTGQVYSYPAKLYMEGRFTHTGAEGDFPWNATLWEGAEGSAPSSPYDISGRWAMMGGEHGDDFKFDLALVQQGSQLSGTMICTSCEGHCVTIVGYDDDLMAFRCLNSYGDTWNGNGYFYLPYDKVAENLGGVRYIENLFTDRSSTEHAYTARINVTAHQRNQLIIRVGAEGREAKTVWDTPCQVECKDDSITICIDVPLPSYASSAWPPVENQWYAEITNSGPGWATVNEVTLARLIGKPSCLSVGKFSTETYKAQNLPLVKADSTVKVYVKGREKWPLMAAKQEWFSLKFEPASLELPGGDYKAVFNGSLTVSSIAGPQSAENREVIVYKKSQPDCLNLPSKWTPAGSAITGPNGGFTFDPQEMSGVYAAAILDSSGNVLASSAETSLPTDLQEIPELIPRKKPELEFPEGPIDELGQTEILPGIRDAFRTDLVSGRRAQIQPAAKGG